MVRETKILMLLCVIVNVTLLALVLLSYGTTQYTAIGRAPSGLWRIFVKDLDGNPVPGPTACLLERGVQLRNAWFFDEFTDARSIRGDESGAFLLSRKEPMTFGAAGWRLLWIWDSSGPPSGPSTWELRISADGFEDDGVAVDTVWYSSHAIEIRLKRKAKIEKSSGKKRNEIAPFCGDVSIPLVSLRQPRGLILGRRPRRVDVSDCRSHLVKHLAIGGWLSLFS